MYLLLTQLTQPSYFTGYPLPIRLSVKKHRTLSEQYVCSPVVVHPGQRDPLMLLWLSRGHHFWL